MNSSATHRAGAACTGGWPDSDTATLDPWRLVQRGFDPAQAARDETLFALANGCLGVRGGFEEQPSPSGGSFLVDAWERSPIDYHERFPGFAATTDTRVPVADGCIIRIRIDDEAVDLDQGEWLAFERSLDLRSGTLSRRLRWRSRRGQTLDIHAERVVPFAQPGALAIRYRVTAVDFAGRITLESAIAGVRAAPAQGDDPRIGIGAGIALQLGDAFAGEDGAGVAQRSPSGAFALACVQGHDRLDGGLRLADRAVVADGVRECFVADLLAGRSVALDKFVGYAWQRDTAIDDVALAARSRAVVEAARTSGFDGLIAAQRAQLDRHWQAIDLAIDGDPATEQALRFDLFHLLQSAPRDGRNGLAAKGLTGEGYEGHCFWDSEAFVLPVFAFTAPELARGMLEYRWRSLDHARRHAREMDHPTGALFAWRTIGGDECSAYFPSGSAQYHINAAVAFAIRIYVEASGDRDFLAAMGAEILFETARIWLQVGHFNPRRDGAFCIHAVTGPDEYSALVDNNWYTNRLAQEHLWQAVAVARQLAAEAPQDLARLRSVLALGDEEIADWQRAADAMSLPFDERLGIVAQDDAFLDKPRWPADEHADGPLLLRHHPLTIYRHQVCKQADALLALVLAGRDVDAATKRRSFDYYEAVTVHDSTLSASTFAILASEVGDAGKAWNYFNDTLRVDLDDRHGNASHGAHMAAMAGAWLALTWGFAGLRCDGGTLRFAPRLPTGWNGYRFAVLWQGCRVRIDVKRDRVGYLLLDGAAVTVEHHGEMLRLQPGDAVTRPLRAALLPRPFKAVIFDLDGVLADTAPVHFAAWRKLATELGFELPDAVEPRLKGIDRAGSLAIVLEHAPRAYSAHEQAELATRKNGYYVEQIGSFGPQHLLPGAREALLAVRAAGLKTALASASRNAPLLIERLGIAGLFDFVADAGQVMRSKPDPQIFLAAAAGLGIAPADCLGIEDAAAGIAAIDAAGMTAIGVGDPVALAAAAIVLPDIRAFRITDFVT